MPARRRSTMPVRSATANATIKAAASFPRLPGINREVAPRFAIAGPLTVDRADRSKLTAPHNLLPITSKVLSASSSIQAFSRLRSSSNRPRQEPTSSTASIGYQRATETGPEADCLLSTPERPKLIFGLRTPSDRSAPLKANPPAVVAIVSKLAQAVATRCFCIRSRPSSR